MIGISNIRSGDAVELMEKLKILSDSANTMLPVLPAAVTENTPNGIGTVIWPVYAKPGQKMEDDFTLKVLFSNACVYDLLCQPCHKQYPKSVYSCGTCGAYHTVPKKLYRRPVLSSAVLKHRILPQL